ncbi:hypothetical protein EVG20_g5851 [Dentipellis fragilis]|uniref:SMC hinge domain-containing protein n=1 Tax=Dentipellis fragilis TaxID=205917 RepID=A0A4Y9YSN6_9AGAM|nr:hypothetical protein EVG20_g5851 [Dentipellis fragilis]
MRIEELVLEGFKSYPVRTQITGWDPSFNAITGLNGSGKSNILDAICFVLGITNMTSMRAQNQQDLIYKRGQAGITKASVTIVFDNSDKEKSPAGFESLAQITVTRQIALPNISKYLLNGHKSQQQSIQTLFQSVQLNINNPNFLIMQGRITKVLNMRPQEILGMVEEAAGTRMFEDRKDKAKKTMGKKEKRVDEITSLLAEEITPKLDTLRAEKRAFLQVGHAKKRVESKTAEIEESKRDKARKIKERERIAKESEAAERDAAEVRAQRERELKKGGKFKKMEDDVAELDKTLVKIKTQADIKRSTIADEQNRLKATHTERKELEAALAQKQALVDARMASYNAVKQKHTDMQTALDNKEDLLQNLLTGITGGGSEQNKNGGGYMGQLAEARAQAARAVAEEEQTKAKLDMSRAELAKLQARWKAVEREAGEGERQLAEMKANVDQCRKRLSACGWSAESEHQREVAMRTAKAKVQGLTEERDGTRQRFSALDFNYAMPSPNFDPRSVKGPVASLISLEEANRKTATALEITAGGKLYNVVVDDEHVGKELLQRGNLKKRVTIIPLTKISRPRVTDEQVQNAKRIAPGKVQLALSLIGYPDEVERAMAWVFGDTLELQDVERRLCAAREELGKLEAEEAQVKDRRERWRACTRDLEIKLHEMNLLEEQVGGSNATRLQAQVEELKSTITALEATLKAAQQKQADATAECKKLEKDMVEFKDNREGKTDELRADILKRKAAVQKQSVGVKTEQKELQTAQLELEQLQDDIASADEKLQADQDGIAQQQRELEDLQSELDASQAALKKASDKLQEERATLTRFDNELADLEDVIRGKKQALADTDLALKQLEHAAAALAKEKTHAQNVITSLEKQHEWIVEENHLFGKEGTQYDFTNADVESLRAKAEELENQQRGMKKKVNPKVINMIDSVEKRESSLKKMLGTVLKDKEKIEQTIEELDRYKRDALQTTWEKVNGDFGGIFAELLPGNFAKLQPPEGQDLMDGLEIKVQLGSVWKQSLTELSGGQRSLIALSLIMALLQFKPAPVYILDEIDAALDLSHTQHIGTLFRTRFRGAQFVVVSLKEGLFTNANVLFRTRFRDGTSIVERTAQRSTSALYDREEGEDRERRGRRSGA